MADAAAKLRALADAATPGPWEQGDPWSLCGVMPERYGEGKCVHCHNIGTDPVWVGRTDINGKVMLAHRHRSEPYEPDHIITAADGSQVCGNYDYDTGGVCRAEDARLIALAPDLARGYADALDALDQCGDLLFGTWDDDEAKRVAHRRAEHDARAVLADADRLLGDNQ